MDKTIKIKNFGRILLIGLVITIVLTISQYNTSKEVKKMVEIEMRDHYQKSLELELLKLQNDDKRI